MDQNYQSNSHVIDKTLFRIHYSEITDTIQTKEHIKWNKVEIGILRGLKELEDIYIMINQFHI